MPCLQLVRYALIRASPIAYLLSELDLERVQTDQRPSWHNGLFFLLGSQQRGRFNVFVASSFCASQIPMPAQRVCEDMFFDRVLSQRVNHTLVCFFCNPTNRLLFEGQRCLPFVEVSRHAVLELLHTGSRSLWAIRLLGRIFSLLALILRSVVRLPFHTISVVFGVEGPPLLHDRGALVTDSAAAYVVVLTVVADKGRLLHGAGPERRIHALRHLARELLSPQESLLCDQRCLVLRQLLDWLRSEVNGGSTDATSAATPDLARKVHERRRLLIFLAVIRLNSWSAAGPALRDGPRLVELVIVVALVHGLEAGAKATSHVRIADDQLRLAFKWSFVVVIVAAAHGATDAVRRPHPKASLRARHLRLLE